jgi:drug/metabolite transporter (DMT)-like permease
MPDRKTKLVGMAAISTVVIVWSTFLVISRSGVQSGMTIFDIAALRYGIAGLICVPIVLYYKPWRTTTVTRLAMLAVFGGVPYGLMSYVGFIFAPAAHGGVFLNGMVPALALLIGYIWLREKPLAIQIFGSALIIAGAGMAAVSASSGANPNAWIGDIAFFIAGAFFAVFLILQRQWRANIPQILLAAAVVGAVIYLPIWALFLPTTLAQSDPNQIALQAIFQGLFPNLLGLILLSHAVRRVGSTVAAAFLSAVPGVASVMGLVFLGEDPGLLAWSALPILTTGILLATVWQRRV